MGEQKKFESQVVKLDYPVEHAGGTITEMVASRRMKAADLRGIKTDEILFDDMFLLVSRLFAVPTSVVDNLDSDDLFKCVGVVNSFLPNGQTTGDRP